jgi:hypothetical protein
LPPVRRHPILRVMTILLAVLAYAAALVAAAGLGLSGACARRALGWRLLAHAGWPLTIGGAIVALHAGASTLRGCAGGCGAGLSAPTWALAFGFTWIAFGLLFTAFAALAPAPSADPHQGRRAWIALVAAWTLCWLPHGLLAVVAFGPVAVAVRAHWGTGAEGAPALAVAAILLLGHFACSAAGLSLSAWEVWAGPAGPTVPAARGTRYIPGT